MTLVAPDPLQPEEEVPSITLAQIIRQLDVEYPDYTEQELATLVLERIVEEPDPLEMTRPAIIIYTANVRRAVVRRIEQRGAGLWDPIDLNSRRREVRDNFRTWLMDRADTYVVVGGRHLRAGAMTINDWRTRISELRVAAAKDLMTAARDEAMVIKLERKRVQSIDQYLEKVNS